MSESGDVASRVATLEGRWKQTDARLEHLDSRVGTLAETMSVVLTKVDTVVTGMDRVSARVNQPVNLWAILSVFIAFLGLCIIIVGGGSSYVDLRLIPLSEFDTQLMRRADDLGETVNERGEVIGEFGARLQQLEVDFRHVDELRHDLEEQVSVLREKAAAAEVSRRATGDHVRQVDEMGSRAWVGNKPSHASKVGD